MVVKLFGENDGKSTPTNIHKKGGGFGEQDITYPLLLIQKPYFECDLNPMVKSERLFYQNVSSQSSSNFMWEQIMFISGQVSVWFQVTKQVIMGYHMYNPFF